MCVGSLSLTDSIVEEAGIVDPSSQPVDRFGGAELRYSATAHVVASLGEDFKAASDDASPDPLDATNPAISLAF